MKICFSTLGCPEWTWNEILATAKDLGYDGIEIRGIGKEIYVPHAKPFLSQKIDKTRKELKEKGLEIPCLTSSCYLFEKNKDIYLKEGKEYIDLAEKLGVPYVRVLGDRDPQPNNSVNIEQVADMLIKLGDYAKNKNVTLLIETNGVFADSNVMKGLMEQIKHPNVGVLWDVHHPYRFMGESMQETYDNLKKYILHVHVKDSVVEEGNIRYCLLGSGDLPLKKAMDILKNEGYAGYISLEWVKRWYYHLEEPGIVFSHFINEIKKLLEK